MAPTRSQAARRILAADGANLLGSVGKRHRMEVMAFAQEGWDAPADNLDEVFRPLADPTKKDEPPKDGRPADSGLRTDLRLPLERSLKQDGEGEGKIIGVVLLSDGQHNMHDAGLQRRDPPAKKAIELGEHALPIFPVGLGARQPPPDVALVAVRAQPTVFKDVDANVEARFKVSGLPAQEIVVEQSLRGQSGLIDPELPGGRARRQTGRGHRRLITGLPIVACLDLGHAADEADPLVPRLQEQLGRPARPAGVVQDHGVRPLVPHLAVEGDDGDAHVEQMTDLRAGGVRRGQDDPGDPLGGEHLEVHPLLLDRLVGVAEQHAVAGGARRHTRV